MNREDYEGFIQHDTWIRERIETLFKMKKLPGYITSIEFGDNHAYIHYEVSRCSCCSPDYESDTFTTDEIFGTDEEAIAKFNAEEKRQKEAAAAQQAKEAAARKRQQEKEEREKFEELKKKYGDKS